MLEEGEKDTLFEAFELDALMQPVNYMNRSQISNKSVINNEDESIQEGSSFLPLPTHHL